MHLAGIKGTGSGLECGGASDGSVTRSRSGPGAVGILQPAGMMERRFHPKPSALQAVALEWSHPWPRSGFQVSICCRSMKRIPSFWQLLKFLLWCSRPDSPQAACSSSLELFGIIIASGNKSLCCWPDSTGPRLPKQVPGNFSFGMSEHSCRE